MEDAYVKSIHKQRITHFKIALHEHRSLMSLDIANKS